MNIIKLSFIFLCFLSLSVQAKEKEIDSLLKKEESLLMIDLTKNEKKWYRYGKLHNLTEPAKVWNNNEAWYKNGQLHRDNDLPAVIIKKNLKMWFINGQLHRDNDLPAVIWPDGTKEWRDRGLLHRDSGPAIITDENEKYWFIKGKNVNQEEFADYMKIKNIKEERYE